MQWLLAAAALITITSLWLGRRDRRRRLWAEERLQAARQSLRETQKLAKIGEWEYDIRTDGIRWSEETFDIFGLPSGVHEPDFADVLLGIHPEDLPAFDRAIQRAITAQEPYHLDIRIRTADGQQRYIHARGTPIVGTNGKVERILGTVLDITERKEAEVQLAQLASRDPLTGLANRRHLMEQLYREVTVAHRHGSPLTVCVGDLDLFKSINDTYGHIAGDGVLTAFARLLSDGTRSEDTVARMGGDEFCIVFPRTSLRQAQVCIERIRLRLENASFSAPDGRQFHSTATFGLTQLEPGTDAQALLRNVDEALYDAKRAGRNQCASMGLGVV
jgi:diguanylate cyclase (GGDEF)-like protein/PAS domain S-box-containing protein